MRKYECFPFETKESEEFTRASCVLITISSIRVYLHQYWGGGRYLWGVMEDQTKDIHKFLNIHSNIKIVPNFENE